MILYKYTADCSRTVYRDTDKSNDQLEIFFSARGLIPGINANLYTEYCVRKKFRIMITNVVRDQMTIVAAITHEVAVDACEELIRETLPQTEILKREEITTEEFERELTLAYRADWLDRNQRYIFNELGIEIRPEGGSFFEGPSYKVKERILSAEGLTRQKTLSRLSGVLASDDFREEIDRIYSAKNERRFLGHPVHYLITAGDKGAADDMLEILIPALLQNKRLLSGRVCDMQDIRTKAYRDEHFENVFSSMQGGTVVINLAGDRDEGMYATGYHDLAEHLGKELSTYGNQTLFIFVDVSGKRTISDDTIAAILANADMIHLTEGHGDLRKATAYLKRLAARTEYRKAGTQELTKYLPRDKEQYTVTDIYTAYNKWYGSGLRTHIYKAYKTKDIIRIEPKKKVDRPYEELQKMTGLTDVKRVTDEILAVAKMQKMRREMGLKDTRASMHMLFSGNPGTAKTTVARLLAQILKEEAVLTNGHIVECGRQDLVGKYVGWTAKIVEEKFKAARGGILFIDEAYSLVEDGKTYGAEAINTIVQEMENHREETIVIFAGYPDRMREFLEQNEGLASRIAFHLNFPDYTPEELSEILDLMAGKQGYRMEEAARDKSLGIFRQACGEENYGNGRYVRNLLEHAIMRQAERLLKDAGSTGVDREAACLIIADDLEQIGMKRQESRTFGFL